MPIKFAVNTACMTIGSQMTNQRCMLSVTKQAISIKHTMVGHFYMTLTLQTFIWLDLFILFSPEVCVKAAVTADRAILIASLFNE